MDIDIDAQAPVRDVIVRFPQARKVLGSFGIDTCCGGGMALAAAAAKAKVPVQEVVEAIRQAASAPCRSAEPAERSWVDASLVELVDHIEATHHVFMKEALPRLADLLVKVSRAHGANHGDMLEPLQATFSGLRAEIEAHLMKEEQILFPYIRQMEASVAKTGRVPPIHCGTVENPIRQMEVEHENAGEALARMRSLTADYALPQDACPTFSALFDGLRELEADLHEHIHLENNILFPRVVKLATEGH